VLQSGPIGSSNDYWLEKRSAFEPGRWDKVVGGDVYFAARNFGSFATFKPMRRASSKVSTFVLSASRPRIAIGKVVQSERKIRSEGEDDEPLADYQR
jgi:hypothetical protein